MKTFLALAAAALFSFSTFAAPAPRATPEKVDSALATVKEAQNGLASIFTLQNLGKGIAVTGAGVTVTGGAAILLGNWILATSTGNEVVLGIILYGGGGYVVVTGSVIAAAGLLVASVAPTSASAADLQDSILASQENFVDFLNLPVEAQRSIIQVSPKLERVMVEIAEKIKNTPAN